MDIRIAALLISLPIAACSVPEPSAVALPSENGVPYRVLLQTFDDGAYADQPFRLLIQAAGGEPKTVLRAAQCKDVRVGQTADALYVFYGELMLNGFSSFQFAANEPRVILCDLRASACASTQRELIEAGAKLSEVCTYRTGAGV
jgi:hypothetical protein